MGSEVKFAPAPFDDAQADVILRTSDGMYFRVHKIILSLTSSVFKDMFSLPLPEGPHAQESDVIDGVHVVSVSEDYPTLDLVLRFLYPIPSPAVNLQNIATLLEASRKYELRFHDFQIRRGLREAIASDAVGVYALAEAYDLADIAKTARKAVWKLHLHAIDSPLLHFLSVKQYRDLFVWRHGFISKFCTLVRSCSWYITTPGCVFAVTNPCLSCYEDVSDHEVSAPNNSGTHSQWFIHKSFKLYLKYVGDSFQQGAGTACVLECVPEHAWKDYYCTISRSPAGPGRSCNGLPGTALRPFAEALASAINKLY